MKQLFLALIIVFSQLGTGYAATIGDYSLGWTSSVSFGNGSKEASESVVVNNSASQSSTSGYTIEWASQTNIENEQALSNKEPEQESVTPTESSSNKPAYTGGGRRASIKNAPLNTPKEEDSHKSNEEMRKKIMEKRQSLLDLADELEKVVISELENVSEQNENDSFANFSNNDLNEEALEIFHSTSEKPASEEFHSAALEANSRGFHYNKYNLIIDVLIIILITIYFKYYKYASTAKFVFKSISKG